VHVSCEYKTYGAFLPKFHSPKLTFVFHSIQYSMATRWTNDPRQGSAFHEILLLPTVAPHLARPYYTPGTAEYLAAEAARRQEATGAETPAGLSNTVYLISISVLIMTTGAPEGVVEPRAELAPAVAAVLLGM
jgi:hypothetical protein